VSETQICDTSWGCYSLMAFFIDLWW